MTKKRDEPERPHDIKPPAGHLLVVPIKDRPKARHLEVHEKLPPGFSRYRGKGNPFKDGALVELAIRVKPEGSDAKDAGAAHVIMIAGPKRAWIKPPEHRDPRQGLGIHPSEWDIPANEFGSIAGTKLAPPELRK